MGVWYAYWSLAPPKSEKGRSIFLPILLQISARFQLDDTHLKLQYGDSFFNAHVQKLAIWNFKKTWNAWNQLNISFWYLFFTWHAQRADRHLLICYEGDNSNKVNANENNKKHTFRTAIDSERNNNQDINDEQGVCFFFHQVLSVLHNDFVVVSLILLCILFHELN